MLFGIIHANAQTKDSTLTDATLQNCIQYALSHQPYVQQSLLDQEITEREIKTQLADWYPQLNLDANYQNNFHLQSTQFGNQVVNIGTYNTSYAQFALTQTIFNRDVLIAAKSAGDVRTQSKQLTISTKIDVVSGVSKAYYDVLQAQKQIEIISEDILLLERSLKDAYNQYRGGIVDKTDYQRATISLNNAKALKKNNEEALVARTASLKQVMSYPINSELVLTFDSAQMVMDATLDTTLQVNYDSRIEFQLFQTQRRLQLDNLKYYKWGYLPTLSAYAQYNFNYLNNQFSKLYSTNYPNSYAGLSLSIPIFQGTKRTQQVKAAELQVQRLDYSLIALKDSINQQFQQAIATYKANYTNYALLKENLALALDVYNTIQLQYKSGVKTYLDVIQANSDLFTTQVTYINALFQLLSSKVDVQKALGTLPYQ
jgi:outer membrane protein TolC